MSDFWRRADAWTRRRSAVIAATCVIGAALWANLGGFHGLHTGDSIVPILVSLQQWTPFYWEQGRFGMLVPLITVWIHHPLVNLIAENTITFALGLGVLFLAPRLFMGKRWLAPACLAATFLLVLFNDESRFEYLGTAQPFATSLGLCLLCTLGFGTPLRPIKAAVCVVGIFLALWVTPTSVFALIPALLCLPLIERRRPSPTTTAALGALALGGATSSLWSRALGDVYGWASPLTWGATLSTMWVNTQRYRGQGLGVVVFLSLAIVVALLAATRSKNLARSVSPLLAGAVASTLGMASVSKVLVDPSERYSTVSWILLLAVSGWTVATTVRLVAVRRRRTFPLTIVSVILMMATTVAVYGKPSLSRVRRDLDRTIGGYTNDLIRTRSTHFVGNYWRVWPAVFHFNMELYERGSSMQLFGITHRSRPTAARWLNAPEWRLAAAAKEHEILWYLRGYGLPFAEPVAIEGSVVVLKFIPGDRAPSGFPEPQRRVAGME